MIPKECEKCIHCRVCAYNNPKKKRHCGFYEKARPQGKWNVISLLDDYVYLHCSKCGQSTRIVRDAKNEFCCIKDVRDKIIACPYCGAKIS